MTTVTNTPSGLRNTVARFTKLSLEISIFCSTFVSRIPRGRRARRSISRASEKMSRQLPSRVCKPRVLSSGATSGATCSTARIARSISAFSSDRRAPFSPTSVAGFSFSVLRYLCALRMFATVSNNSVFARSTEERIVCEPLTRSSCACFCSFPSDCKVAFSHWLAFGARTVARPRALARAAPVHRTARRALCAFSFLPPVPPPTAAPGAKPTFAPMLDQAHLPPTTPIPNLPSPSTFSFLLLLNPHSSSSSHSASLATFALLKLSQRSSRSTMTLTSCSSHRSSFV
mmetsp:Transcript_7565/g.20113  ORF Transcript_7565/g.20113 Transcript_7565/m.20113 type:complete len:287 (+) Transcript_7565:2250-3110(+)